MRYQLRDPNWITFWHRWYAWRPVITGENQLVWLEPVWRMAQGHYDGVDWIYRLEKPKE